MFRSRQRFLGGVGVAVVLGSFGGVFPTFPGKVGLCRAYGRRLSFLLLFSARRNAFEPRLESRGEAEVFRAGVGLRGHASFVGQRDSGMASWSLPGTAVRGAMKDIAAEPDGSATTRNLGALSPRDPNGCGVPRWFVEPHPCVRSESCMSDSPFRETRTAFFGGRGARAQSGQGGAESRTFGTEGHPVCTSEALRTRKIGEGAAPNAGGNP